MNIAVIGCGTMGSGIAQVAAMYQCKVKVYDINSEALSKSKIKLDKILNRLIEKGRIDTQKKKSIIANISYVDDLKYLADSHIVIEAIIENLELKKKIFSALEAIVSQHCILASNTSSLSITSIAASCQFPERFIGIHFFNPVPLMKLVEIIPCIQTSEETKKKSIDIINAWEKITVVAMDTPGFIVNKVARPYYGEAAIIAQERGLNENSYRTIDRAMTDMGFKMGPFVLMDYIGNDINYKAAHTVFTSFYNDDRYRPSLAQKRLVDAGYLGRKTGRGWYSYPESDKPFEITTRPDELKEISLRIILMLINEAADTLYKNIATREDIELAMTKGVNYPKGLLKWADDIGVKECVNKIDDLYSIYREDRYRCSPLLSKMALKNENFYQ